MNNPELGTVFIACATTIVSVVTIYIIDRFGRKILMLASLSGQLVSAVVIGASIVSNKRKASENSIENNRAPI